MTLTFRCIMSPLQVSYASSSEALSDQQHFSSFFRTVPSESWAVLGVTRVIEEFGWSRAAIITQDEISFKSVSESQRSACT